MLCYMIVIHSLYVLYAECRDIQLRKIFIGFYNRDLKLRTPLEKCPGNTPWIYATGEIRLKPPPPPDFEILKF